MQSRRALVWLVCIGLSGLLPFAATHDPYAAQPEMALTAPNADALFGTDLLGRDVFSRTLYGGQRTLSISLLATLIAAVGGMLMGCLTLLHRRLDDGIMLAVDALLALPGLVVALVVVTLLRPGELAVALAVGFTQLAPMARIVRTALQSAVTAEYVQSARGLGARPSWIIRHHVLPQILPAVSAYVGVMFAYCLLNAAALSFLGLGGNPAAPDWGVMLAEGRTAFRSAPWVGFFPGVMITLTVLITRWAFQAR
ncbi:MAG: ABC transporter permease [bacterium]|nr:ABC transporter permease [bacterium]